MAESKQVYVKRPLDTVEALFDHADWVAAEVAAGQLETDLDFRLRVQPGPSVEVLEQATGVIVVRLGRGDTGRVYDFSLTGKSARGTSFVDARKLRVRDPVLFDLLPEDSEIPIGAAGRVTDPEGEYLLDPAGLFITAP